MHFESKNPEEENGAVVVTYQSTIPSYKGEKISHPAGLQSSSAIRLLCHMLREPLFDELRTKQQLGYIVSAYYEIGYSSRANEQWQLGPLTTPVDFITINILSRKMSPPDITDRIEEFLKVFRTSLETMEESEIRDHANALSAKLLKPIQKLQTEANDHFGKIQRYGPEVFFGNGDNSGSNVRNQQQQQPELPWKRMDFLAQRIKALTREELIDTWDRMVQPDTRCRVVSCVYGKTFPLSTSTTKSDLSGRRMIVNNNFEKLLHFRKELSIYDNQETQQWTFKKKKNISTSYFGGYSLFGTTNKYFSTWKNHPNGRNRLWTTMMGIGVLGVGVVSFMAFQRARNGSGSNKGKGGRFW